MVNTALRSSIQHGLDNRDEALTYAMQFARSLDTPTASRFVGMYVNELTLDYGTEGRNAIRKLLEMGYDRGIIPIQSEGRFRRLNEPDARCPSHRRPVLASSGSRASCWSSSSASEVLPRIP